MSELLTKPKPWHMLSIKGREPFIRMHLWLNDPLNVDKLRAVKEERENLKRKHSQDPSITEDSNPGSPGIELADPYSASMGSPGSAKKQRLQFNERQREALKVAFSLDPYPSPSAIDFLGQELGMEPRSVINWFHSHRMRLRQQESDSGASPDAEEQQKATFDPLHFRILVNQRLLGLGESRSEEGAERASPEDLAALQAGDSTEEDSRQSLDGEGGRSTGRSRRKPLAPQWVDPSSGGGNVGGGNEEEVNGSVKEDGASRKEEEEEDGAKMEVGGE